MGLTNGIILFLNVHTTFNDNNKNTLIVQINHPKSNTVKQYMNIINK